MLFSTFYLVCCWYIVGVGGHIVHTGGVGGHIVHTGGVGGHVVHTGGVGGHIVHTGGVAGHAVWDHNKCVYKFPVADQLAEVDGLNNTPTAWVDGLNTTPTAWVDFC